MDSKTTPTKETYTPCYASSVAITKALTDAKLISYERLVENLGAEIVENWAYIMGYASCGKNSLKRDKKAEFVVAMSGNVTLFAIRCKGEEQVWITF